MPAESAVWPGVLLYVLYSYVSNLIGVPFGVLFLPYLLLVALSAYTSIGIVANIDGEAVRDRLVGIVPARTAGGVLAGLAGLFIVLAVIGIIAALLNQRPVGQLDVVLWIADLATIGPTCLLGGILLLQGKALYAGSPLDVVGMVTMLVLGLICLMLFARFAQGIAKSSPSSAQDTHS
jgi:hypothetical protein